MYQVKFTSGWTEVTEATYRFLLPKPIANYSVDNLVERFCNKAVKIKDLIFSIEI